MYFPSSSGWRLTSINVGKSSSLTILSINSTYANNSKEYGIAPRTFKKEIPNKASDNLEFEKAIIRDSIKRLKQKKN